MSDQMPTDSGALSAAPIFDDAIYFTEALRLPANQTEDDLETDIAVLARESGIHDPYSFLSPAHAVSRALSTWTMDSDHESSISVHSQETQSTSLTSAYSRTSRDHLQFVDPWPTQRIPPKLARASLSVDNYDQALGAGTPNLQQRHSTSAVFIATSPLSTSPSLHIQPPRRKRGSALFAIFRKDSYNAHSPQTSPSKSGTDSVINSAVQSPIMNPVGESDHVKAGLSLVQLNLSLDNGSFLSALPKAAPRKPAPRARYDFVSAECPLAYEAFQGFKTEQKEQFDRISVFECYQRSALKAHYQCSLSRLVAQYEQSRHKKIEQHSKDLDHLEDLQLIAEHDLRQAQELEKQNVATALKHMEAYCLGTNVYHPEHAHTVSQEDFQKLDRQRTTQKNLPRKLQSAINVLRARQERETKRKLQKQEAELTAMDEEHEKQKAAHELEYTSETENLETLIETRRKRLLQRWDLKFEMWRREWEEQHSTALMTKFEHESWPSSKSQITIPISQFSALAQYIRAAA